MHLSIHSDCFLSDSLGDCRPSPEACRAARGGLLRGLAVIGIAGLLGGLTCLSQFAPVAEAGPAPRVLAQAQGTAVNLMHREVIGH